MDSQKGQFEPQKPSSAASPSINSCRKKKSEDATFLEDIKDHIDEFIHASVNEHTTCFKKTIQKMFGMSKNVAERSSESKEVESTLPLRTVVADYKYMFYLAATSPEPGVLCIFVENDAKEIMMMS